MKVLHINTYDCAGGAEKIAYTLFKHQKESAFLVKKKLKFFEDEKIIEFKNIAFDKAIAMLDKISWKLGYKKEVRTLLQAGDEFHLTYKKLKDLKVYQEADIIHLHNIHGNYFDISALNAIAKEKKVIWTIHDMWAITGGDAHLYEEAEMDNAYLNNKLLLKGYPLNGPLVDRRRYFLNYKKNIYRKYADKIYFVPVSNWLKNCMNKSVVYHEEMQIEMIYNGIETSKFNNLELRNWPVPRVLFFNSDNPFKGAQFFIDCLKNIQSEMELFVVGNPIQKLLNPNIRLHSLDKTTDENQLSYYFNNVDILVFPSTAESFGLLPAEAMLCGVMVVSSDAGGLVELVIDGKTGILFNNGNEEDLVRKLEQVVNNLNWARKVGAGSREFVEKYFNLTKMLNAYDQLYEKACSDLIPNTGNAK